MAADQDSPDENGDDDDDDSARIPSVLESVKKVLEIAVLVARLLGM